MAHDVSGWLPVFLATTSCRCLVVGAGRVATRKAKKLLEAGAHLALIAPDLSAPMQRLMQAYPAQIQYQPRCYTAEDMQNYQLIVAATDDAVLNTRIAQVAQRLNIPVNVANPGHLSTLLLPNTLRRGVVQIALCSGGASPLLMRRLSAYLDALIPQHYGDLAKLLQRFRESIKTHFPDIHKRRHFYEKIVDGVIAETVFSQRYDDACELVKQRIAKDIYATQGEVYLVGTGPGDPELLTLKALRVMQQADVVIYDRLIGPEILKFLRKDARRYYVGKARAHHSSTQATINQLLIEYAKAGHKVVRLKGGDPFVFGRGGEEMLALQAAGIVFHIVPGITAATGCAASTGIPLTHREVAKGCLFLTGHCADEASAFDWPALAQSGYTLVFYMGVFHLESLCQRLLRAGMAAETPVAIVQNGSLANQQLTFSTLAHLSRQPPMDHTHPGLVIIGQTVTLSPQYRAPGCTA
ncbi:siroheme synthase CysG [Thiorhodospira sibirica]|uniref:siroheme synthase CysG n=1 Tax=Thiorhodospira sibirica TaxID=154347 RepID=UPI00022C4C6E|nr:siroheme synthase CysG [Thiorhodospira sibirica]